MTRRNKRNHGWPEDVRLAILVARGQGMKHPAIAASLTELLGQPVDPVAIRMFCCRYGAVAKRLDPWTPPEGYRREYKRLQGILGTLKARQEILLVAERDKRRARAA